jgi:hypothetical protein
MDLSGKFIIALFEMTDKRSHTQRWKSGCRSRVRVTKRTGGNTTEELASPVAGNGSVPYESLLVPIVSKVPIVPNVLNGLNCLNVSNVIQKAYSSISVCDAFSSRMNNAGSRQTTAARCEPRSLEQRRRSLTEVA